jgi:hypothetical protein
MLGQITRSHKGKRENAAFPPEIPGDYLESLTAFSLPPDPRTLG